MAKAGPLMGVAMRDEAVDLTGRLFVGCVFQDCVLTLRSPWDGGGANQFHGCRFIGPGWPKHVRALPAWAMRDRKRAA